MRIHYIQHVHFETPANIYRWADYKSTRWGTKLFLNDPFPDIGSFDLLVILGGPMGVYDEDEYPWLKDEKKFIERSIKSGKKILGICLGAQLIADVLGGKVYKNRYKEIGWFDVQLTSEGKNQNFSQIFLKDLQLSTGMVILLRYLMELSIRQDLRPVKIRLLFMKTVL